MLMLWYLPYRNKDLIFAPLLSGISYFLIGLSFCILLSILTLEGKGQLGTSSTCSFLQCTELKLGWTLVIQMTKLCLEVSLILCLLGGVNFAYIYIYTYKLIYTKFIVLQGIELCLVYLDGFSKLSNYWIMFSSRL